MANMTAAPYPADLQAASDVLANQMCIRDSETAGHDVEKAEGKFVRQSGGRGQYGHAVIRCV